MAAFASQATAQGEIRWQYSVIPAVAATVTGADVVAMQSSADVVAVVPDAPVAIQATDNSQKWVDSITAKQWWGSGQRKQAQGLTPTIAIVDSGIDTTRVADFGGRVLGQVNLASLAPNSPGDGRGHGTMVASVAAGAGDHHAGVDPDAPLISLDVVNDQGEGLTSDVIAAADWILQNKDKYNIRVANFSLEGTTSSSFLYDPLSKAVEQLWFGGVVVVAAAGNYATNGAQSGVLYAPASDPFVITVGALDIGRDGNAKNTHRRTVVLLGLHERRFPQARDLDAGPLHRRRMPHRAERCARGAGRTLRLLRRATSSFRARPSPRRWSRLRRPRSSACTPTGLPTRSRAS